ncbi:hypothetical protein RSPO_m00547 (plasmid) [Ralstonia solanacearum Po82]|uniref:Uncharacterized protein n=1 Tax=Ralstonia solanacearum (strain Po82) TaxID=1031711 RepID=F6G7Q7_RALS8|nr:hypothetical protein RSPO_m00547 [Ralstonia solanacearum Po82]
MADCRLTRLAVADPKESVEFGKGLPETGRSASFERQRPVLQTFLTVFT